MLDKYFWDEIKRHTPRMNPRIQEGFAVKELESSVEYLDNVWKAASTQFPPGLEYCGIKTCDPIEEYGVLSQVLYNKRTMEFSRSDVYLAKYQLKFDGKLLPPRYFNLLYSSGSGDVHLRGAVFTISPVIADMALSVAKNGLYMPFLRDKITFTRSAYNIIKNDQSIARYLCIAPMHKYSLQAMKAKKTVSVSTHYLFTKYGLRETLSKYYNVTDIKTGSAGELMSQLVGDDWTIYRTSGFAPQHIRGSYTPHNVAVAIKNCDVSIDVENTIAGMFYILDNYPDRITNVDWLDDPKFWQRLLGQVLNKSGTSNEGKLLNDVSVHLKSLDNYVDAVVRGWLEKTGIYVNDIYDLLVHIQDNISQYILGADLSTSYGKSLMCMRYVMSDIVSAIFRFTYELNAGSRKITEQDVKKLAGKHLNRDLIFRIKSNHGEVNIITSPNDSKLLRKTSHTLSQSEANASSKKKTRLSLSNPEIQLSESIVEAGSILSISKSEPSGRGKLNPWLKTDIDGAIVQNPELIELLTDLKNKLR